jgi:hypothetical protein
MNYKFSLAKQIGNKGYFLRMTANVLVTQGLVEVHGVEDPTYVNAIEFATHYFFERQAELTANGCRLEVTEFDAVPHDTGMLCVVLGTVDILCQHFGVACENVMSLDDQGNFCFPA